MASNRNLHHQRPAATGPLLRQESPNEFCASHTFLVTGNHVCGSAFSFRALAVDAAKQTELIEHFLENGDLFRLKTVIPYEAFYWHLTPYLNRRNFLADPMDVKTDQVPT